MVIFKDFDQNVNLPQGLQGLQYGFDTDQRIGKFKLGEKTYTIQILHVTRDQVGRLDHSDWQLIALKTALILKDKHLLGAKETIIKQNSLSSGELTFSHLQTDNGMLDTSTHANALFHHLSSKFLPIQQTPILQQQNKSQDEIPQETRTNVTPQPTLVDLDNQKTPSETSDKLIKEDTSKPEGDPSPSIQNQATPEEKESIFKSVEQKVDTGSQDRKDPSQRTTSNKPIITPAPTQETPIPYIVTVELETEAPTHPEKLELAIINKKNHKFAIAPSKKLADSCNNLARSCKKIKNSQLIIRVHTPQEKDPYKIEVDPRGFRLKKTEEWIKELMKQGDFKLEMVAVTKDPEGNIRPISQLMEADFSQMQRTISITQKPMMLLREHKYKHLEFKGKQKPKFNPLLKGAENLNIVSNARLSPFPQKMPPESLLRGRATPIKLVFAALGIACRKTKDFLSRKGIKFLSPPNQK